MLIEKTLRQDRGEKNNLSSECLVVNSSFDVFFLIKTRENKKRRDRNATAVWELGRASDFFFINFYFRIKTFGTMKSSILSTNKTKQWNRANTPTCINIARYNKMSPAGIKIPDKMGRRQKLKTLCETRWASRSYSLFTFLSAFSVVCSSFEELEHGGDTKLLVPYYKIWLHCLSCCCAINITAADSSLCSISNKRLWSNPSCRWE